MTIEDIIIQNLMYLRKNHDETSDAFEPFDDWELKAIDAAIQLLQEKENNIMYEKIKSVSVHIPGDSLFRDLERCVIPYENLTNMPVRDQNVS